MMGTIEQFQKSVFDAIDIEKVIWIDDFFGQNAVNKNLIDTLNIAIRTKYELQDFDSLKKSQNLSHIDFSAPIEVILKGLPTETDKINQILKDIDDLSDDLEKETFEKFIAIFEKRFKFQSVSLQEWNEKKDELIKDEKTLFFVDLDLSNDGGSKDEGKFIVEHILKQKKDSHYCVLFTHNCQHGADEERQRLEVTKSFSVDVSHHAFSVFSKSIFSKEDDLAFDFKIPELLKRAFIRKLCSQLAELISSEMKKGIDEINNQLNQRSIYELDGSVFHRTVEEGASEFDFLHRLFSLKQTASVQELVTSNHHVVGQIKKLRGIQKIRFEPQNPEEKPPYLFFKKLFKAGDFFVNLRHGEMWTDATVLNKVHSPLGCGDTFLIGAEGEKYLLLEQSCDLMVRKNGIRKLNEALLVSFKQVVKDKKNDYTDSKYHTFSIPGNSNEELVFDFSQSFNVNLNLLDICVFNENGLAKLNVTQQACPDLVFLPGWIEKYNALREKLTSIEGKLKPRDEICGTLSNFMIDASKGIGINLVADENTLSVNIQRSSRLNSPFVDILLRKLYMHKTRLPLEHDFSNVSI